jgi:hypothetical protein
VCTGVGCNRLASGAKTAGGGSATGGGGGGVGGLLGAPAGKAATRADYEKVVGKMTRSEVDRLFGSIGAGQPSSADDALKPVIEGEKVEPRVRQVWNALTVVRYGAMDNFVFVGFDKTGKARTKSLRLVHGQAKEWEGELLTGADIDGVTGKVTFND